MATTFTHLIFIAFIFALMAWGTTNSAPVESSTEASTETENKKDWWPLLSPYWFDKFGKLVLQIFPWPLQYPPIHYHPPKWLGKRSVDNLPEEESHSVEESYAISEEKEPEPRPMSKIMQKVNHLDFYFPLERKLGEIMKSLW